MCVGEIITFNIFLLINAVPNLIGNCLCIPIIFRSVIKTDFSTKIILFLSVFCVIKLKQYLFLSEKGLIALWKAIGIQIFWINQITMRRNIQWWLTPDLEINLQIICKIWKLFWIVVSARVANPYLFQRKIYTYLIKGL